MHKINITFFNQSIVIHNTVIVQYMYMYINYYALYLQCFLAQSWRMRSDMSLIWSGPRTLSLSHSDSLLTPSYWEYQYVTQHNIFTDTCTYPVITTLPPFAGLL